MATFKAVVKKGNKRADGTWNVVIRFTHECKVRFIPTTMYITRKDMTASFKIKNAVVIDRCNYLIKVYRERVNELNLEFNEIDIDTVVNYIKRKKDAPGISFTEFANMWMKAHSDKKGILNYRTALNSFQAYFGRENILCNEVTAKSMKAFEESLKDRPRAQSVYPVYLKVIFNAAREYYNDEDNDIVQIKDSLRKYRPRPQNAARKRALDVDVVRRIFALPYKGKRSKGKYNRHDLALDCFRLSFCLMGINTADLYNATVIDGDTLVYERTKAKDRRPDNAEIQVDIPPCIMPVVNKYRGTERVFEFHRRYYDMKSFNRAVNIGLKEVGREIGVERLQYYAARHSLATIAVNDVGISKYIVNDMLNHTDPSLRVTELYIKKDFRAINEANAKVLDYVLNCKRNRSGTEAERNKTL